MEEQCEIKTFSKKSSSQKIYDCKWVKENRPMFCFSLAIVWAKKIGDFRLTLE
jgi:hypothetical protein